MSWSTGAHTVNKDAIDLEGPAFFSQPGAEQAQADQFNAAVEAAKLLAKACGRDIDQVTVNLNGHANPDHAPHEAWADESITVMITCRPYVEPWVAPVEEVAATEVEAVDQAEIVEEPPVVEAV